MTISARKLHEDWQKQAGYREAYEELGPEFELASELIRARQRAGLSQVEVARRMGTTQSTIARIDGGKHMPSTRTLERYAAATGSIIKLSLVPADASEAQP